MPPCPVHERRRRATPVAALSGALLAGVALAAVPAAASAETVVASDGFDRSTSSGWGQARTGGAWSLSGGSGSSVSGSEARVTGIQPGRQFRAQLPSVRLSDATVRAAFTVPSATNFYYSAEARRQADGSAYRARARIDANRRLHTEVVRFAADGSVVVLAQKASSQSPAVGTKLSVELLVTGTNPVTVRSKVYRSGTATGDWQVTGRDTSSSRLSAAGTAGVSAYVGNAGAAQTIRTSSFTAAAVSGSSTPPAPPVVERPSVLPTGTGHGAAPIGSTSYPVPASAVFVSTSGSDSAPGTRSAPVRTVTKALTKVSSGQTIVIRGGTYHEYFLVPPGKAVTIQSYPGEAVWFDGASRVTGFTAAGSAWRVDGWNHIFDASPTYTTGAPDGTAAGWQFVNPARPMAAHPDAVWVDGAEQTQVGSLSQVKAGTFYVDRGARRLYLGTNPGGRDVRASTLAQAVSLRAPGTTVRGIGFRRYASSVPQQGVITTYYPKQTLENVEVRDSGTAGVGIFSTGSTLRRVTITGSGQIGLQAAYADGLVVDDVSLRDNNDQGFNPAPSAGGFKLGTTRGVTVRNSEITRSNGNQLWADQSTYDMTFTGNTITNGTRWGIVLEISSTAVVADNVIAGNAFDGMIIANTDRVSAWNNTFVGNGRAAIAVTQDKRRIQQLSVAGHDKRRAQPDLSMPWISRGTSLGNNVYTGGTADKSTLFQAQSWERVFSGEDMVAYSNGNVFSRVAPGTPRYTAVWGNRGAYATTYATLADYARGSGRDGASWQHVGASPVTSGYQVTAEIRNRAATVAQPLPAAVAGKIGRATGTRALGAWR